MEWVKMMLLWRISGVMLVLPGGGIEAGGRGGGLFMSVCYFYMLTIDSSSTTDTIGMLWERIRKWVLQAKLTSSESKGNTKNEMVGWHPWSLLLMLGNPVRKCNDSCFWLNSMSLWLFPGIAGRENGWMK